MSDVFGEPEIEPARPEPQAVPGIRWAEYPQRKCRITFTDDGLIDHSCALPDQHPGPDASPGSPPSVQKRLAWELANPGWEKMVQQDDPFADAVEKLKGQR